MRAVTATRRAPSGAREDRRTALLQLATDRLCGNRRDRIVIECCNDGPGSEDEIWFEFPAWSACLTRVRHSAFANMPEILYEFMPGHEGATWDELAFPIARHLFAEELATQSLREAAAIDLGLTHGGALSDLPPDRLLMDRALYRILGDRGIDVLSAAARLSENKAPPSLHESLGWSDGAGSGVCVVATTTAGGAPVLSAPVALGAAFFLGGALLLPHAIPDVLACALSGRRLGELISTGHRDVDDKRVVYVRTAPDIPFLSCLPMAAPAVMLTLEQDLVQLGLPT